MKLNRIFSLAVMVSITGLAHGALSINSSNNAGVDNNTSAIVDNAGNVMAVGTGYIALGTFGALSDGDIQSFTSTSQMGSSFNEFGSVNFNLVDGIWETTFENAGDTSAFVGQAIFTVIGNGGTLAESTQVLVYRHEQLNGTGNFNEAPNSNGDAIVSESGTFSTGSVVLGEHGRFQHDFSAGAVDAYNLVVVPEPSSTALLGLGGLALLIRRRR